MNLILVFILLILILVDVFLAYELPTHIAYILGAIFIAITFDIGLVNKIFIGILTWFCLLAFHYLIWRKFIEKIQDNIIAPKKHVGGIDGLVGKKGMIKEVEGIKLCCVNEEFYEFKTEKANIITNNTYEILSTESNKLII